jgi:hypothetical protein
MVGCRGSQQFDIVGKQCHAVERQVGQWESHDRFFWNNYVSYEWNKHEGVALLQQYLFNGRVCVDIHRY